MATRELIVDPAELDCSQIVAGIDVIREFIPQRGPLEQLTAIVVDDVNRHLCVGYKDASRDEYWVSGHMPGMPVMPGVLICEAAAQVFSYFVQRHDLSGVQLIGFGGLDNVRFRGVVRPGDRLVVACSLTKLRRGRIMHCDFQAFVGTTLVCEGSLKGIPLPVDASHSKTNVRSVVPPRLHESAGSASAGNIKQPAQITDYSE
jgi:3-hydroxyacyl-[acyl-carrier-protein] dehydratase